MASVDNSGLKRKLAELERAGASASVASLKVMGREFGISILSLAPRDTNEYARDWAMALNAAGVGPFTVPDLRKSGFADRLIVRLENQVSKYQAIANQKERSAAFWRRVYENRYAKTGRKGEYERDCRAKLQRAEARAKKSLQLLAFSKEQLELLRASDGAGIVIWGRSRKDADGNVIASGGDDLRRGALASVRTRAYGGTGRIIQGVGDEVYLILHNKAAHATIVESRHRVLARSYAAVKRPGVQRGAKDAAVRELIKQVRSGTR